MKRTSIAFLLTMLAVPPAAAQDVLPPIHPNDLNTYNAQQRIDEIRRSGNSANLPQMNSLESQMQTSRALNRAGQSSLSPIPEPRPQPSLGSRDLFPPTVVPPSPPAARREPNR